MSKAIPCGRSAPSAAHRLAGLCLLVCYLFGATSLLPFLVMCLAELDASHAVVVECGSNGAGVRLHHRAGDFTPCSRDHHTLAGRAAALLCHPSTEGDHVLAASQISTNTEVKNRQPIGAPNESGRSLVKEFAVADFEIGLAAPLAKRRPEGVAYRKHANDFHRSALASVRLLI